MGEEDIADRGRQQRFAPDPLDQAVRVGRDRPEIRWHAGLHAGGDEIAWIALDGLDGLFRQETKEATLLRRDRIAQENNSRAEQRLGRPAEEIVPYVSMPERMVPGEPMLIATALPFAGFGRGMICRSLQGRPIKVEGNPRHPDSLGATDVFAEAAVLSLYDPDRSRTVREQGDIRAWEAFIAALKMDDN